MKTRARLSLLLTAGLLAAPWSAAQEARPPATGEAAADPRAGLVDRPLADYRGDLLDVAFSAVTALPIQPHIKNRSRAQEKVVATCLELDQPRRALDYIERIDNWRRGTGYADLAHWLALHDMPAEARHFLRLAAEVVDGEEVRAEQAWRRDRIRARIARTYRHLGDAEAALPFEAGLAPSEHGLVQAVRALRVEADDLDRELAALDVVVAAGDFEQVRNALMTGTRFFDRFYEDEELRSRVERKIRSSWDKLPPMIRMELLMKLADHALAHGDQAKALALVQDVDGLMSETGLHPEQHVPLSARVAALRFQAGEPLRARRSLDAALALFEGQKQRIANVFRAEALRPVAEALVTMQDEKTAGAVYAQAIEEGFENPNSRPRAEDLAETCCSMALHGLEPGEALWARIRAIHGELGDPW